MTRTSWQRWGWYLVFCGIVTVCVAAAVGFLLLAVWVVSVVWHAGAR